MADLDSYRVRIDEIDREIDIHKANTFIYRISFDFLRKMGLSKIEDLPEYEKYHNL